MSVPLGIRALSVTKCFRDANIFGHQIFIIIFTFLIYASFHLSRKPISVLKNTLEGNQSNCSHDHWLPNCAQGGWSPFNGEKSEELLGLLDSSYLFAYAVGMFFSGHIAERSNLRWFLVAGMVTSGIMTVMFGLGRVWNIHSLAYFVIVQFVCGIVQSSGWPPVVAIVANWFGKGGRGLIFGLWNCHTYTGNILGSVIAGAMLVCFPDNWSMAFIVPGVIIICMSLPAALFLIPHPGDLVNYRARCQRRINEIESSSASAEATNDETSALIQPESQPAVEESQAISFYGALKIPGVIEFSFSLFFAKLVSYTFLYWLPKYIGETTKKSPADAANMSAFFDFGGMIGGVLAGVISDYTGGKALTCSVMLILAAPAMFVYQYWGSVVRDGINIALLLLAGSLVNGPYSLITTAVSADLGQSLQGNAKALATVSAIIDGTGSVGAAVGPLLAGLISPTGWKNVFYLLIACDIVAMLLLVRLSVKEVRNSCRRSPAHQQ